jgi:hypothetical protein
VFLKAYWLSVFGEVKVAHGLGSDYMLLLFLVEAGYTLDGHIIGLRGSGSEKNLFGVRPNEVSNMLYVYQRTA